MNEKHKNMFYKYTKTHKNVFNIYDWYQASHEACLCAPSVKQEIQSISILACVKKLT